MSASVPEGAYPSFGDDLPESRLYTFIDGPREHALYFLEGQRLIRDVPLVRQVPPRAFAFLRDALLSIQPTIALIKGGEQLGFYIDSERPFFRLKIETAHAGDTRCTLLPHDFDEFPTSVRGLVRVEKHAWRGRAPYQSILELQGVPLREIVNLVLSDSYQVKSAVHVSPSSDQSVMLHVLPPLPREDDSRCTVEAAERMLEGLRDRIEETCSLALTDPADVKAAFADMGFRLIASRGVRLACSCQRARMVRYLRSLAETEDLFDPGQASLDVTCEYCGRTFVIARDEVEDRPETVH